MSVSKVKQKLLDIGHFRGYTNIIKKYIHRKKRRGDPVFSITKEADMEFNVDELDDLMARERLTFDELAKKTGISRTTLYRIRNDPKNVKLFYIDCLSEFFKVDPFSLIKS